MQAIHNTVEKTLRAERLEEWQCGAELIHELLARGANPSKLDGTGRTALAVMKEFPLLPDDTRNGKEDIVSYHRMHDWGSPRNQIINHFFIFLVCIQCDANQLRVFFRTWRKPSITSAQTHWMRL